MPRAATKTSTAAKSKRPASKKAVPSKKGSAKPALTGAWHQYTLFLAAKRQARQEHGVLILDAMEERVFESLAAYWGEGRPVTVLQAMRMPGEASPTTVHRRLKSLRKKDLIRLQEDEIDNRIKYVHATDAGMAYLDLIGVQMKAAMTPKATV